MGAIKISTLLLFARIFPGQKFQRMLWAVGLFISTYSSIMVIAMIFQCRPLNRVWDPTVKAECIEINKVWIVMGSLNVVTDFLLLYLPLPQIWKLQMRRETKLQLISIFSIGSLSVTHIDDRSNFDFVLTVGSCPIASLSFRPTASRSCVVCLCTRPTPLGMMPRPIYGLSLKYPLLCWVHAPSPTVLYLIGSLEI